MEDLKIRVDLQTQQAAENAGQLVRATRQLKEAMTDAGAAVSGAESKLDDLKQAAKDGGDAVAATAKKTAEAATAADKLSTAAGAAAGSQRQAGEAAKAAGTLVEDAGRKGRRAGDEHAAGAEKAEKGQRRLREESARTLDVTQRLADGAKNMVTGWLGLAAVTKLMQELADNAERAFAATREAGGRRLDFDDAVADVVDNAGLTRDPRGTARVRQLALNLMGRSGLSDKTVAANLLAQAQSSGINVVDPARPDLDGQGGGFGAVEAGAFFANRTRLDPLAAKRLIQMAAGEGVTDRASMESMLAQLEQGAKDLPISDPKEALTAIIDSTISQRTQGVPFNQALALTAGAATTVTSGREVDTRVGAFNRVALGMDPEKKLELAKMAAAQGVLGDVAGQTSPELERQRQRHAEDKAERDRQLSESQAHYMRDRQRKAENITEAEKALALAEGVAKKNPQQRAIHAQTVAEKRIALDRAREDLATFDSETGGDLTRRGQMAKRSDADAAREVREEQMRLAYGKLPLDVKQRVVLDGTAGLTGSALSSKTERFAGGEYQQWVVAMLGAKARERYATVLAGAARPDVGALGERGRAFRASTAFTAAQGDVERQRRELATAQGAEFSNVVEKDALSSIQIMRADGSGRGQTGGVAEFSQLLDPESFSKSEEGLQGKQMAVALHRRWSAFVGNLTAAQRQRYGSEIGTLTGKVEGVYGYAMKGEGLARSGSDIKLAVQRVALEVGQFISRVQQDAVDKRESVPQSATTQPAAGAGQTGAASGGGAARGPRASAAGAGFGGVIGAEDAAAFGGPVASAGGGGGLRGASVTVNIGQYITPAGGEGDFTGRLEGYLG